jgi:hypothetical protein
MADTHHNEPRFIGWGDKFKEYYTISESYTGWRDTNSHTIFRKKDQKDLFVFAMALGYYNRQKSPVTYRQQNIRTEVLTERQKWAVLPIGVTEKEDLLSLQDETSIYGLAEQYANEGILILKSQMEKTELNYSKALEAQLREILKEKE